MIHHLCQQNTSEWRQLRAGIPTASQFFRIITPTGRRSSQREEYMFQLLGERITGRPQNDSKFNWAMERGSALEQKACEYFEFQTDLECQVCGFVTDDTRSWGCSPDRLVGETGILSIKAPLASTHLMYLLHDGSGYKEYRTQAQGELWITDRTDLWFLSYHPDLPWSLTKIARDKQFIEQIAAEVAQFSKELELLAMLAHERGYFRWSSVREPQETSEQQQVRILKESLQNLTGRNLTGQPPQ